MLVAGDVLRIYCRHINPPNNKYVICVCPTPAWFFFINSEPRRAAVAQVQILPSELPCLAHNSFVDTSKFVTFSTAELDAALREKKRRKGRLSQMLKLRIKRVVQNHTLLPPAHIQAVENNF